MNLILNVSKNKEIRTCTQYNVVFLPVSMVWTVKFFSNEDTNDYDFPENFLIISTPESQ